MNSLNERFPGIPVVPCIGNNDAIHHYQVVSKKDKNSYYGDLYSMWFSNYPAN
jgi:hypothetical protein